MALQSQLFRGDLKLEAAAVSPPAHITQGASGEHVRKIQLALNQLDNAGLDPDGKYGPKTAAAVLAYKQKRNIINKSYQTKADPIVGQMTVTEMDKELLRKPGPAPVPGVPVVVIGKRLSPRPKKKDAKPSPPRLMAVVRGNPHQRANAIPLADLLPSIPPKQTYLVDVSITPSLPEGQAVDISIIGSGAPNGTATVSPTTLSKTGQVIVTAGDVQTTPGNAGKLQIQASFNGKVLATSEGFTVCAHPNLVRITSSSRLVDPTFIGIAVRVQVESDSGSVLDLDQAKMNELVEENGRDSPPFAANGKTVGSPSYQKIGLGAGTDNHGFRPFPGAAGELRIEQVHVFKCLRCGAEHIPIPNSGFRIIGRCFTDDKGKTFKLEVTRVSVDNGVISEPGDDGKRDTFNTTAGFGSAKSDPPEVIKPPNP